MKSPRFTLDQLSPRAQKEALAQLHGPKGASGAPGPANAAGGSTPQSEKQGRRIRQRTAPLMNQTEKRFYMWFGGPTASPPIHIQALTFRLANGVTYRPDFAGFYDNGTLACFEVKGPWMTDDAVAKLKMAASVYPQIEWSLCSATARNEWTMQRILP